MSGETNAHYKTLQPKVTSYNVVFHVTNQPSLNPEDLTFTKI